MGLCGSTGMSPDERRELLAAKKRSQALEKSLKADQDVEIKKTKLLFLGAGESGKTTMLKQMEHIYGQKLGPEDCEPYTTVIWSNLLDCIKMLANKVTEFGLELNAEAASAKGVVEEAKRDTALNPSLAGHIATLWKAPAIQETYRRRAAFQLQDSCAYWMENVERIGSNGYLPTFADVLRARVKTTGIVEKQFIMDGRVFRVFDVGGQRNERKKWIHCFEGVTAVMFVVSLCGYNQLLYEDEKTNRLDESLRLFESTFNSRWFQDIPVILFLNKKDIFEKMIKEFPLSSVDPSFENADTFEKATDSILKLFVKKLRNNGEDRMYPHITTAVDTSNMTHVFNAVKDMVIRGAMNEMFT